MGMVLLYILQTMFVYCRGLPLRSESTFGFGVMPIEAMKVKKGYPSNSQPGVRSLSVHVNFELCKHVSQNLHKGKGRLNQRHTIFLK